MDAETFNKVVELLLLSTVQVNAFLATTNLELWDLKWELAITDSEIVIVATIDHDSMRLTLSLHHELAGPCVVHFNKQSVRDYYKTFHVDWHAALEDAKRRSNLPGSGPFKDVYNEGIAAGTYPEPPGLDEEFADLQSRKCALVTAGPSADPALSRKLAAEEVELLQRPSAGWTTSSSSTRSLAAEGTLPSGPAGEQLPEQLRHRTPPHLVNH